MENTKTKIREIIVAYKADFVRVDGEERYKWIAVKCFQDNWDIDAPDFHAMLVKAFEKRANLIGSSYYFPYKVLAEFASLEPETVRTLFHNLYDETLPLDERIVKWRQVFEPFVKRQNLQYDNWKQSFQDLHAISVYLAFKYPDKYYIFKSSIYKKLAVYVGFAPKHDKKAQYANYTDLFDVIREVVVEDDELTALSLGRLTEDCFADSNYRMLAMDIAYFGYFGTRSVARELWLSGGKGWVICESSRQRLKYKKKASARTMLIAVGNLSMILKSAMLSLRNKACIRLSVAGR
ncbi:hypothetical protein AGMMS49975_20360 [Clostridia bacterium]|nr:hypothetical protein AGMMS49975_20360 [Clostridia bacterium]